ncbi:MAG: YeeE/YedE thiosulfate transporter family protein [Methylococcales bacterium]
MTSFTPYSALLGGSLIGLSAALLLLLKGRIAGITGIMDGLLPPYGSDALWRIIFLIGMVLGVLLFKQAGGNVSEIAIEASNITLIFAGLLVGFGANLGSGCTSGHGICGIALASKRSIVATLVFMFSAFATVFVTQHLF